MSDGFTKYDGGKTLHPTSVDVLNTYHEGQVVELPPFAEGQPLVARMSRPSIMFLAKTGKIPNKLLAKAGELFSSASKALSPDDDNMLNEVYDIMHAIAEASLLEPTLADIEGAGLTLTDEQLTFIFNYSQNGVNALEQFRRKREMSQRNRNGNKVQRPSK